MNKRQKEVIAAQLRSEQAVIKELKKAYAKALDDINAKLSALMARADTENIQSIIYQVDYQKALKTQISGILDVLNGEQFTSISGYLKTAYEDGFVGTMYDLQGQGIPLIFPIDQEQVTKAIRHDTKLSKKLYSKLGEDVAILKKRIQTEISRGIASSYSYAQIAKNISNQSNIGINKSIRIARTEGHRISEEAAFDAQKKAKEKGADIVKQWDATLDKKTRPHHVQLDGQIREIDEPFEVEGRTAMYPGGFGIASEDIHCRCTVLQRARWAVNDESDTFTKWDGVNQELLNLKPKNYEAFKKSYQKMVRENQTLNDVTSRLLERAKAAEPQITSDLQDIVGDTRGTINYEVEIDGETKHALDFRLKGGGSLKRKITSDFVEGIDLDYIEGHIYDNVRYTDLVGGDFLVEDYAKIQAGLEARGYKILRVKNTLGNANAAYRGLNTVVESPDGYRFELQFHTPESIDIKERVHVLYEEQRKDSTSAADKLRLDEEMKKISSSLPDIKDIDTIKSYNNIGN